MSRQQLTEHKPYLVKRPKRRNWYAEWTCIQTHVSKVKSTGIPIEDREGAEQWLSEFTELLNAPDRDNPTVGDLLGDRLDDLEGRSMTMTNYRSIHKRLKKYFGSLHVEDLTPKKLKAYWKHRKNQMTSITRELEELRSSLLFAKTHNIIEFVPPIEMPAKRPPRDQFITKTQGQALLQAAEPLHLRLYLMLAMTTGARRGAVLGLTWDRIDLNRGILDFNEPDRPITNKKRAVVPISGPIQAALRDAMEIAMTDHVIEWNGRPAKSIKRSFAKAAGDAGLGWVTPHILKHSVISWLAEDGYTVDQISDLTETDPVTVRRIYRKVNPESLTDMADSLAKGLNLLPAVRLSESSING